jgi:thiol:disulfide interchange protein/DsbC/DsbD-like thiol-disulfide interchange protein
MTVLGRVLAGLLLAAAALHAGPEGASKHTKVRLVPEVSSVQPGTPFTLAVHMTMDPHWHTYWQNPGDIGREIRIAWTLPDGMTAGAIEWPAPDAIRGADLTSYGYEGEVVLLVEMKPPATLAAGTNAVLAAKLDWVECTEGRCIPSGKVSLDVTLPVRTETPALDTSVSSLFQTARGRLPGDGAAWKAQVVSVGPKLALTFESPKPVSSAAFFSDVKRTIEPGAPQVLRKTATGYSLELARDDEAEAFASLGGILKTQTDGGPAAVRVTSKVRTADVLPAGTPVVASAGGGDKADALGVFAALGFAFVGGLILNLMPCVLPVLSLKVLSFVRHSNEEGGKPWRHGVAYTVGVVGSFLALAGALLALRAGGEQIGWGFQLQSPVFVAALVGLFFLIGLNLFGVFEVGSSLTRAGGLAAGKSGLTSSLFDGALATVVATPCTAPFMGSALGFALSQPAYVALLIFASLGLGMALPYLVLSLSPSLLRFVPRPGAWMEAFKQLMGFFMMGTVVVLVWIFSRQTDTEAVAFLLGGLVIVSLGAWIYGRALLSLSPRRRLSMALGLAVGLGGLGLALAQGRARAGEGITWQPFSAEAVAAARAEGRPVFIDFTAAWCFSCQVNERVALRPSSVTDRFREHGIVAFKADWTLEDERITQALASYGRSSVPLYVLYAPGTTEPRLLPEILTPDIVLGALDETLGKTADTRY